MPHTDPLPYHPSTVWVIVADGRQAKAYLRVPGTKIVTHASHLPEETFTWDLQPVDDFAFEAEHVQGNDSGGDVRATIYEGGGNIRHLREPHIDVHHKVKEDLARRVAEQLNRAKAQGRFDGLVIVAPPAWLGFLRPHIDKSVNDAILIEVGKEFANLPLHELTERLRDVFPARGALN